MWHVRLLGGAYVFAADLALDAGDLPAARPFIAGAVWTHAERQVAPDSLVAIVHRPERPWVPSVPPECVPLEDVARLETLLRITDEQVEAGTLLETSRPLSPPARHALLQHLELLGRHAEAERALAAIRALRDEESPAPPPR